MECMPAQKPDAKTFCVISNHENIMFNKWKLSLCDLVRKICDPDLINKTVSDLFLYNLHWIAATWTAIDNIMNALCFGYMHKRWGLCCLLMMQDGF